MQASGALARLGCARELHRNVLQVTDAFEVTHTSLFACLTDPEYGFGIPPGIIVTANDGDSYMDLLRATVVCHFSAAPGAVAAPDRPPDSASIISMLQSIVHIALPAQRALSKLRWDNSVRSKWGESGASSTGVRPAAQTAAPQAVASSSSSSLGAGSLGASSPALPLDELSLLLRTSVLAGGFRASFAGPWRGSGQQVAGGAPAPSALSNADQNSLHDLLCTPRMALLWRRIGPDATWRLLTTTVALHHLERDCYLQLCGPPLNELLRMRNSRPMGPIKPLGGGSGTGPAAMSDSVESKDGLPALPSARQHAVPLRLRYVLAGADAEAGAVTAAAAAGWAPRPGFVMQAAATAGDDAGGGLERRCRWPAMGAVSGGELCIEVCDRAHAVAFRPVRGALALAREPAQSAAPTKVKPGPLAARFPGKTMIGSAPHPKPTPQWAQGPPRVSAKTVLPRALLFYSEAPRPPAAARGGQFAFPRPALMAVTPASAAGARAIVRSVLRIPKLDKPLSKKAKTVAACATPAARDKAARHPPSRTYCDDAERRSAKLARRLARRLAKGKGEDEIKAIAAPSRPPAAPRPPDFPELKSLKRHAQLAESSRMPRALRPLVRALRGALRRHRRCPYRKLIDAATGPPPAAAASIEQLLEHRVPEKRVAALATAVVRRVFPMRFWGTSRNLACVSTAAVRFATARRLETISLASAVSGITISQIPWAQSLKGLSQERKTAVVGSIVRMVLLELILRLLRCHFHVTETEWSNQRVVYYPLQAWKGIREVALKELAGTNVALFKPVANEDAEAALRQRHAAGREKAALGFSMLRIKPRQSSFRPIVNMSKRSRLRKGQSALPLQFLPINIVLRPVFDVLKFEADQRPGSMGSAVAGLSAVHPRLASLATSCRNNPGALDEPAVYGATVDVQKCFDTMPRNRVLDLALQLMRSPYYSIRKSYQVSVSSSQVRAKLIRTVSPGNSGASSADQRAEFSGRIDEDMLRRVQASVLVQGRAVFSVKQGTIFVDTSDRTSWSKAWIEDALRVHLSENIVQIGPMYLQQQRGIPQGSVLSSLLANLYLATFEREHILPLLETPASAMHDRRPPSLLMRQMDDFLVLSRDRGLVEAFLKVIHTRIGEFGLIVQARKTMTSYRSDVMSELSDLSTHTGGHELAWNGLIICARTLSVRADHRRYLDRDVRDWLSLKALSGTALNAAFKRFIVPRSQAVLLDEAVCCKAVVARNVYEMFVLAALKLFGMLHDAGEAKEPRQTVLSAERVQSSSSIALRGHNPRWVLRVVLEGVEFFNRIVLGSGRFRFPLSLLECRQLSLAAFRDALGEEADAEGAAASLRDDLELLISPLLSSTLSARSVDATRAVALLDRLRSRRPADHPAHRQAVARVEAAAVPLSTSKRAVDEEPSAERAPKRAHYARGGPCPSAPARQGQEGDALLDAVRALSKELVSRIGF